MKLISKIAYCATESDEHPRVINMYGMPNTLVLCIRHD